MAATKVKLKTGSKAKRVRPDAGKPRRVSRRDSEYVPGEPDPGPRYSELRHALKLNKSDLEREVLEQPALFQEVAETLARAISRRDGLKERVSRIGSTLYEEVRRKLERDGQKTTEKAIASAIETEREYEDARDAYKAAESEVLLWTALKEAYQQRSFMLREIVSMTMANYTDYGSAEAGYERHRDRVARSRKEGR